MREEQQALSPAETGQILGVSRDTVLPRLKSKDLGFIKFGRRILIPKREIERILRVSK